MTRQDDRDMRCGKGEGEGWKKILLTTNTDMVYAVSALSGLPTMVTIVMFVQIRYEEGEYAFGMMLVETVDSLFTLMLVM